MCLINFVCLFQIFLYQFEGRETVKRPAHCLPYAVVSLIQDGMFSFSLPIDVTETNIYRL